ncbi:hypothetical protein KKF59_03795 [Patescibacteria group bacterium]|nr:hypothetical protein [Patescibacteria group bacterium]
MPLMIETGLSVLEMISGNPFAVMWFLFINGGWAVFLYLIIWGALQIYLNSRQTIYNSKRQWMLLAISVPRMTEQTPRAVENIFAHLAGAHVSATWKEKWIDGKTQDIISVEIASIEGRVHYYVYTTRGFRDLIEASIYAQYPDAEIAEVEDYALKVPARYPDAEWDAFGTEMIPTMSDVYPLRTFHDFEDKVSGEFKDPLAVLLENMSRLGPGEQFWFQIVMIPIEQKTFKAKGELEVKKLTGQKVEVKAPLWQKILELPFNLIGTFLQEFGILSAPAAPGKEQNPLSSRMWTLTPGERKVLEAMENKLSKIVFQCKLRFVYVAKKEVMKKPRIVHPFIGVIKQFNTNDMQSLKPETKRIPPSGALWFFKDSRNNKRKIRVVNAYRARSFWVGNPTFAMNIEELASLWHFPISIQTRPPQLGKTEAKRAEPPMNLPFG